MKKFYILIILAVLTTNSYADTDFMEGMSDTIVRHELRKIRERAERESSNRGRIIYEYVDDNDIDEKAPDSIGNVFLDRDSRVREVHVGIDIDKHLRFDSDDSSLNIGTVTSEQNGNYLKKVNIMVDLDEQINF